MLSCSMYFRVWKKTSKLLQDFLALCVQYLLTNQAGHMTQGKLFHHEHSTVSWDLCLYWQTLQRLIRTWWKYFLQALLLIFLPRLQQWNALCQEIESFPNKKKYIERKIVVVVIKMQQFYWSHLVVDTPKTFNKKEAQKLNKTSWYLDTLEQCPMLINTDQLGIRLFYLRSCGAEWNSIGIDRHRVILKQKCIEIMYTQKKRVHP